MLQSGKFRSKEGALSEKYQITSVNCTTKKFGSKANSICPSKNL